MEPILDPNPKNLNPKMANPDVGETTAACRGNSYRRYKYSIDVAQRWPPQWRSNPAKQVLIQVTAAWRHKRLGLISAGACEVLSAKNDKKKY
jgi:hypothetical protein